MTRYLIKTSGKGMLPAGRVVGFIEADNEQAARDALVRSGQIPAKARDHFNLVAEPQPEIQ